MSLDQKDLIILQALEKADRERKAVPSLDELRQSLPGTESITTVWNRMQDLIDQGLVEPPPKPNMARAHRISEKGMQALANEGLIPTPGSIPWLK